LTLAFPGSILAPKLLSVLATAAIPLILWLWLRDHLAQYEWVSLISLVKLNPWIVAYSNRVLSEASYLALSLASLLVFIRWLQQSTPLGPTALLLAAMIGLCASTRTIGLALIAACCSFLCR
jgi:predicted membrane-bound mannosyltransferase